ncbi:MAG: hypothetical protein WCC12_08175, partial [Anaerolineales bacterium]
LFDESDIGVSFRCGGRHVAMIPLSGSNQSKIAIADLANALHALLPPPLFGGEQAQPGISASNSHKKHLTWSRLQVIYYPSR